jgi:2-keto-3-deoxy-L-rhamnonate aldolase RhmA
MGKIGLVGDLDVQNAIAKVKKSAEQADVSLGIFGATPEAVLPFIEQGYNLIAIGIDTMLIGKAAKEVTGSLNR